MRLSRCVHANASCAVIIITSSWFLCQFILHKFHIKPLGGRSHSALRTLRPNALRVRFAAALVAMKLAPRVLAVCLRCARGNVSFAFFFFFCSSPSPRKRTILKLRTNALRRFCGERARVRVRFFLVRCTYAATNPLFMAGPECVVQ